MNAIKFIKEHGVEKAREVVDGAPEWATHFDGYLYSERQFHEQCFPLSDLKRPVDSVDLVDSYGGIDSCRNSIYMLHELTEDPEPIRQAIADFEKIFGGEHV